MPSEEIAAIWFLTAKAGREEEVYKLVKELSESTRAEDKGCLNYIYLRKSDNHREFALFERWKDLASLQAHITRMQAVYGPPPPGTPPGSLPAALLEPFEKGQPFMPFQAVE